jgi:multicomponent Na+:H+ antiporter subunit E
LLRALGLGGLLFGFWLLLSGHYTPLLVGLGVGSTLLVVYIAMRMDVVDREGVPLHVGGRLWWYLPWLYKEIFIANVEVARIILDPKLPISPIMVRFHGSQQTDLGRAIYANSITLTPGTITTGIYGTEFEIHSLTHVDLAHRELEEDEMDRRCRWVERGGGD